MTEHSPLAGASSKTPDFVRDSIFAVGSTRIIDAVLMMFFVVRIATPGIGLPVNDIAGLLLVAVAAFRRPTRQLSGTTWFAAISILLVTFLAIVAIATGPTQADITRLGRILIMLFLAGFIASGRIDIVSGLKGFSVGLLANIPLFYAGLAPDTYGGLLTGFLNDKNVAGFTYAILTVLLFLIYRRLWTRIVLTGLGLGAVVLTDSRTSMAALAAALIWLVCARFLGPFFRIILAGVLLGGFFYAEDNLSQVGAYAARSGSDELRERIDAASLEKTLAAPWYGHGLGEATTELAGDVWFYHNSYWGLITEGGYAFLLAILALLAFAGFQFLGKGRQTPEARIVEAATIVILLCSFRLGEVFITLPTFIAIGIGLGIYSQRHSDWLVRQAAAGPEVEGALFPIQQRVS
ncbi:O-antigen ligase family protein [Pseudoclavibacter sp. VKM Ac-2867]|uniref:O-antigen ligase family protein n=1 Tax=Pseudoclavibacter sp. VKM Ac-2867 TaxID=2783829 RepID=UPI00188B9B46|nr:O-antigen ligase family protein [Pseudoclavibacter sp. VKM Ac-2867]MBF4457388.1 hypothetical protein [Pseudoclavibacter sp. VKM Ac-2867]